MTYNISDAELNNFLQLTSPPRKKLKINSNNETITIPQSSCGETNDLNLFKVISIKQTNNNNIEIILSNINSNIQVACYLYDSW